MTLNITRNSIVKYSYFRYEVFVRIVAFQYLQIENQYGGIPGNDGSRVARIATP